MGRSRYKFFDNAWNDDLNHYQKGMPTTNIGELFQTQKDIIYTIPLEYQYRPDLIAKKFFGNAKLYWVLAYVNEMSDCPEGFYTGRIIRIPTYERILELV